MAATPNHTPDRSLNALLQIAQHLEAIVKDLKYLTIHLKKQRKSKQAGRAKGKDAVQECAAGKGG